MEVGYSEMYGPPLRRNQKRRTIPLLTHLPHAGLP